jgi:hypothetical protein
MIRIITLEIMIKRKIFDWSIFSVKPEFLHLEKGLFMGCLRNIAINYLGTFNALPVYQCKFCRFG